MVQAQWHTTTAQMNSSLDVSYEVYLQNGKKIYTDSISHEVIIKS